MPSSATWRSSGVRGKPDPQRPSEVVMTATPIPVPVTRSGSAGTDTMRAAVFEGPDRITLQERPVPVCGATDAIVRVTMTTICGTDVHILRGEYPVEPGRIIGHEPVGVIHEVGSAVVGYE